MIKSPNSQYLSFGKRDDVGIVPYNVRNSLLLTVMNGTMCEGAARGSGQSNKGERL